MHMLVENATLPRGQSWERVFPQAQVHTVHNTSAEDSRHSPTPNLLPFNSCTKLSMIIWN